MQFTENIDRLNFNSASSNYDEADRYVARRQLKKIPCFEDNEETSSGDSFIKECLSKNNNGISDEQELVLVLLDINMPGSSGFDVMDYAQRKLSQGQLSKNIVFLLFSSSQNPRDLERAESLSLVKEFVAKPMDYEGALKIKDTYVSA